ncbi:MAG: hypothetical protein ACEQSQ_08990 [Candidatus Paceibacteria bacterium]
MFEEIKKRNNRLLKELLDKHKIKKSLHELINYESVFVSVEYMEKDNLNSEHKRAILYGNLKFVKIGNKTEKTNKKEILFNFGKKAMKDLSEEEIKSIILELKFIGRIIKQLKLIMKVESEESYIQTRLN